MDEQDWARSTYITPRKPTPQVEPRDAMRYLGWALVYLALAPPIAVILWRLAVGPWPS